MSKVQFNLLPDVKLAYNKTQALRRRIFTIALLASIASLILFILLIVTVDIVQQQQLRDSAKEVDVASSKLKGINDIDRIITVQNQLRTISQLHQTKHISSRIFVYLPQLTPATVTINKLDLDLKQNTMMISGAADSQHSVNTFVDTLKTATYKVNASDQPTKAFSSVVESAFNLNPVSIGYTINLAFDPKLFANNLVDANGKPQTPKLTVAKTADNSNKSPSTTLFNSSQTGNR